MSGFREWDQLSHAEEWIIFPENVGPKLSLDEVAITNGELYTIITNKQAKSRKGALVAMIHGTKSSEIAPILAKIPAETREMVKEITLDMAGSMDAISQNAFPQAIQVTDRFHVQQLVGEAVQEIRMGLRKQAMKEENEAIKKAREEKRRYRPVEYENGDTKKQLLARSRYLLFKTRNKWYPQQQTRAAILFREYPEMEKAYNLSILFRSFYESKNIEEAKNRLDKWYLKMEKENIDSFAIAVETIRLHETTILNYFNHRSTNASAESFNAKLKGFRSVVRGVTDNEFFIFRIAKLYA